MSRLIQSPGKYIQAAGAMAHLQEYTKEFGRKFMALGTTPNPLIPSTTEGLEMNRKKCIVADDFTGLTSKAGVFAGGDAVTGAATVILAMGAGKSAAKGIDEYLSNK